MLAAALEEIMPGRIEAAWKGVPRAGRPAVKRAASAAAKILVEAHSEAHARMRKLAR